MIQRIPLWPHNEEFTIEIIYPNTFLNPQIEVWDKRSGVLVITESLRDVAIQDIIDRLLSMEAFKDSVFLNKLNQAKGV